MILVLLVCRDLFFASEVEQYGADLLILSRKVRI